MTRNHAALMDHYIAISFNKVSLKITMLYSFFVKFFVIHTMVLSVQVKRGGEKLETLSERSIGFSEWLKKILRI